MQPLINVKSWSVYILSINSTKNKSNKHFIVPVVYWLFKLYDFFFCLYHTKITRTPFEFRMPFVAVLWHVCKNITHFFQLRSVVKYIKKKVSYIDYKKRVKLYRNRTRLLRHVGQKGSTIVCNWFPERKKE